MALKAIHDSIDEIEEPFRVLYTERNGKFELTGIEGVKTTADVERVQTALVKERKEHKETKDKYSFLADMDITDVQEKLDKYPELETAAKGKLNEEDIEKIVSGRINSVKAPIERERDQLKKKVGEYEGVIQEYTVKERTRAIHDNVREAISKLQGFAPSAVEDAMVFAERMFEVTEDGKVVTKDGVGVTPGVEPHVWLSDMQQKKPHWFGPTQGGGAPGGKGGLNGANNPFAAESWNMTEQAAIVQQNPQRAEQMARAAGTSVGGLRPAARK